MPKLSIIIPVYNASAYIKQCIDSLYKQKFTDWELILVNDGSTDNSEKLCKEYANNDERVVLICQENAGVSTARNAGINQAKGKYITFVDADDYMGDGFLTPMEDDNDEDVIFTQYLCFDHKGTNEGENIKPTATLSDIKGVKKYLSDWLHQNIMRTPWGKFIKKEIIADSRFPIGQKIGEDSVFMFKVLSQAKTIKTVERATYMWRSHSDNFAEKYRLPVNTSIQYLVNIYNAYRTICVSSPHLEATLYFTFFMLAEKDLGIFRWRWFARPVIIALWESINFDYKYIHKQKFKKYKMMRFVYNIIDKNKYLIDLSQTTTPNE